MDRRSLGGQSLHPGKDESQALLIGPTFPLEHFEHLHLIGGERIALDLLKAHSLKPALAGGRYL